MPAQSLTAPDAVAIERLLLRSHNPRPVRSFWISVLVACGLIVGGLIVMSRIYAMGKLPVAQSGEAPEDGLEPS